MMAIGDRPRDPSRHRRRGVGSAGDRGARSSTRSSADSERHDLILFGNESADAGNYQVAIRVAHKLGLPVRHRRQGDRGRRTRDGSLRAGGAPAAATSTSCRRRRSSACSRGSTSRATRRCPAGCARSASRSSATTPARPDSAPRDGPARAAARVGQAGRGPRARARGGARRRRRAERDRGGVMSVLVFVEDAGRRALPAGADVRPRAWRRGARRSPIRRRGYAPAGWARALTDAIAARGATVVLAPGTDRGNEVLAHVAAMLDQPMAANCMAITPGDPATVTRVRWGGSLLEEARVHGSPLLATVAPHAVAADPNATVELALEHARGGGRSGRGHRARADRHARASRSRTPTSSSPAGAASARPRASR